MGPEKVQYLAALFMKQKEKYLQKTPRRALEGIYASENSWSLDFISFTWKPHLPQNLMNFFYIFSSFTYFCLCWVFVAIWVFF